jgi:DNA-binding transcriptional MocR family regulator
LPTHRELAQTLGLNVGTVSRAYAEARRRGLIRGEVGRGTFVATPVSGVLGPREREAQIVDLTVNIPQRFPEPDLPTALRELADCHDLSEIMAYHDTAGSARDRAAGAKWLARLGIDARPEHVVVVNGAQQGILVAVASVVGPGELVLAESHTYPGFQGCARLLGLRVRPVAMDEQGILPEALEAACAIDKPRLLYCMPTLQNPTAAVMGRERRERIVVIARRYDLTIVQDEVHGGLVEDSGPSLATLAPENVITIAGVSKVLLPGLRVAYLTGPPARAALFPELIWSSTWMAAALGSELATRWIEDGTADRIVRERRDELDERHAIARRCFAQQEFRMPRGAYHLWLQLPGHWEVQTFVDAALERGIAITPANSFVVAPARAERAVRISLTGVQDLALLGQSLEKLAELATGRATLRASVRL